jgi:hypothetical protein
MINAPED